jgi:hypothetical protein
MWQKVKVKVTIKDSEPKHLRKVYPDLSYHRFLGHSNSRFQRGFYMYSLLPHSSKMS